MRSTCVAALAIAFVTSLRGQADGTSVATFTLEGSTQNSTINVASPLVTANGTVYVGTRGGGSSSLVRGRLWAISANGASRSFIAGDWIDATPTVGPDGTIYVGSWDGNLYALRDPGTGSTLTRLWEYATGSFIFSSVAIGPDGTLYVGSGDSNLHAVNADGTLKWRFPVPDWVDSSPAVAPNSDVIFGSWDGRVYAVTPDGVERWSFATGGPVLGSAAIAADGTIYIGSTDNFFYALNPNGTKKWERLTGADIESSPAIAADGTIYIGSNDGFLHAVRPDGSLAWSRQIGASVVSSPAVRADGSIVVGTTAPAAAGMPGQLVCVNPADGSVKWRFDADDIVDSSPAIGPDNRIYFTDYTRKLHILSGTSALAGTTWPKWRRESTHKARIPNNGNLSQLVNISTRAFVGTGADILIAGTFIVGGSGKSLVIRGVGPELEAFDLKPAQLLADPLIEVFDTQDPPMKFLENQAWDPALQAVFSQVGAFALSPGSGSAALQSTFPPGGFTFLIKGTNDTTGIALGEVYDAQKTSGRLVNLSSRGFVGTGDNVFIPGFFVEGSGPATLLIRALGPTLATLLNPEDAAIAIAQPTITLFNQATNPPTPILSNTGWSTAPNAVFIRDVAPRVGAVPDLPAGSGDCAMLVTLQPGGYSVVVSGMNNTTGVVLVDLFVVSGY